jgi:hypothetical protein
MKENQYSGLAAGADLYRIQPKPPTMAAANRGTFAELRVRTIRISLDQTTTYDLNLP